MSNERGISVIQKMQREAAKRDAEGKTPAVIRNIVAGYFASLVPPSDRT